MLRLAAIFAIVCVALGATHSIPSLDDQHLQIWGGNDTDISRHPWTVSLQHLNVSFCGGTLITHKWVLTAAHCVSGGTLNGTDMKIRAGSSRSRRGGQLKVVTNVIIHPQYNVITKENDIALLQLESAVTISSAKTASLPKAGETVDEGTAVNVVGWGVKKNSTGDDILQLVKLNVINTNSCANKFVDTALAVTDTKFCATGNGKDVCTGDVGGPVEVGNKVHGLVSPGIGCQAEFPSVFTDVSKFRSWITQVTGI